MYAGLKYFLDTNRIVKKKEFLTKNNIHITKVLHILAVIFDRKI